MNSSCVLPSPARRNGTAARSQEAISVCWDMADVTGDNLGITYGKLFQGGAILWNVGNTPTQRSNYFSGLGSSLNRALACASFLP